MGCLKGCGSLVLIVALTVGVLRSFKPRRYADDACANYVNPSIPSLPGMPYQCGWQELRPGSSSSRTRVLAFIQPNGSWCWSNAGLISSAEGAQNLLIDTLTDPVLAANMLQSLAPQKISDKFSGVVYTHPDLDHYLGDQVIPREVPRYGREEAHAEMIGQLKSLKMMSTMSALGHYSWSIAEILGWRTAATALPDLVWTRLKPVLGWARMQWLMGKFSFHDIDPSRVVGISKPISSSESRIPWQGVEDVHFNYMGAIHSKSDSVILLPSSKICFAGDLLFIGIAPVMWSGPARSWVEALDKLLAKTDDTWLFVPGHGPVTDVHGVRLVQSYFKYLDEAVTDLCGTDPGLDAEDHACALRVLDGLPYQLRSSFTEPQRMLINAKIERKARRTAEPVKVDITTKVKFLIEQGSYLVEDLL